MCSYLLNTAVIQISFDKKETEQLQDKLIDMYFLMISFMAEGKMKNGRTKEGKGSGSKGWRRKEKTKYVKRKKNQKLTRKLIK